MNFGQILREKMKQQGVGAAELSYRTEGRVSEGYIRKLLSKEETSPTLKTAALIAKGLGVRVSELVDADELPESLNRPLSELAKEVSRRIEEMENKSREG